MRALGVFDKFRKGLERSRSSVWDRLGGLFSTSRLNDAVYDDMEEALLAADVGVDTSVWLVDQVRKAARSRKVETADQLPTLLEEAMLAAMAGVDPHMATAPEAPTLYLVVGVNGVGKTTSIGKLAYYYRGQGKRVILAAADTFRAAATEQLTEWGQRAGCDVVRHAAGADPAAVLYDAIAAAKSRRADIILCDTAGRLHNKENLMVELAKMRKVAERELPGSPHEVLLVLDGTTGQNALSQVKVFREFVNVSGLVVTKLDGTAKGGVILPVIREYRVPVKWVGLGEQIDDLEPFQAELFARAICQVDG